LPFYYGSKTPVWSLSYDLTKHLGFNPELEKLIVSTSGHHTV